MAKFQFRLATLLKIRQAERDDRRLRLAEAFEAERILAQRIGELERERAEVSEQSRAAVNPGVIDLDQVTRTSRYELLVEAQLRLLLQRNTQLQQEIERRREALIEADRAVRVLETLREQRYGEFARAESKIEQRTMDELGLRASQTRS